MTTPNRINRAFCASLLLLLAVPDASVAHDTGYTGLFYERFDDDDTATLWYAGVAMGVGALWRPLTNVSVSLRQGVALEYQHKVRDRDSRPDVAWPKTIKTLLLRMPSPRLLTIIHF